MKKTLLLFVCLTSTVFQAQQYKISYLRSYHGTVIENQDPIWLFAYDQGAWLTSERMLNGTASYPFEQTYIQPQKGNYVQVAQLNASQKTALMDSISLGKQNFELTGETKKILGYHCQKAKTIINSNTIELWFTQDINVKGAPTILGQSLGLVLEMVRNGNFVISATKLEKLKQLPKEALPPSIPYDSGLDYRDLLWKSRFTTLKIFEDEKIRFSSDAVSNDSILRFANGTVILRKVSFPEIKAGQQIFIELTEQSNGDAYDRTGSIFLIPEAKEVSFMNGLQDGIGTLPIYENDNGKKYQGVVATETFEPVLELMRFFTPFGIKQYNYIEIKGKEWHEKVSFRQEISELYSALSGKELWVGAFIGNYDQGGYKVSLDITIHQSEGMTIQASKVLPLFNTTNIMEMAGQEYGTMFNVEKGLEVTLDLKEPLKNARLRYITTGHGGWSGGDEFVPKVNTIYLNQEKLHAFTPWRQDCGSYRLYNPASGNFNNGLSSSDYSRSNWCPGTVTNPVFIDLGDLPIGKHTLRIHIHQGAPEGTSFSAWNVSGVLLGE